MMKSHKGAFRAILALGAAGVCAAAQAQYLAPVSSGSGRGARESQYVDMTTYRREMTHTAADLRVLQEDIKLLVNRMTALENELQAKDAAIRQQQEALAQYEQRFQKMERDMVQGYERVQQECTASVERAQNATQKALEALQGAMVDEISRVDKVAARAANAASAAAARNVRKAATPSAYKEVRVEAGDTLSGIAKAAGVSIQALKQANGLKSSIIRVGQVLKIPVSQQ